MTGIQQQVTAEDLESRPGFRSSAKRCRTPAWPTGRISTARTCSHWDWGLQKHDRNAGMADEWALGFPEPGSGPGRREEMVPSNRDRRTANVLGYGSFHPSGLRSEVLLG